MAALCPIEMTSLQHVRESGRIWEDARRHQTRNFVALAVLAAGSVQISYAACLRSGCASWSAWDRMRAFREDLRVSYRAHPVGTKLSISRGLGAHS